MVCVSIIAGFEDQFRRIARAMELKKETGEAVVDHLFEINQQIHLPIKLRDIGVME